MSERKEVEGNWVFNFRRRLYHWEECEVFRLWNLLVSAPSLVVDQVDKPIWATESSGVFSVSSVFKRACPCADPRLRISKLVWVKYLPPKVQFFWWLAWRSRLKTSVFLQKISVLQNSASTLCVFCKTANESVDHVLVSCPFVWHVWAEMLNWWDV